MKLEEIGWNEHFINEFNPYRESGLIPGRVISVQGPVYGVVTETGISDAVISGSFRYTAVSSSDYPSVGDWVLIRGDGGTYMIERVLQRHSLFSRMSTGSGRDEQVIAANIDIMFIVAALDGGRNFTLRGIERYIVMVHSGGADPVILINKSDLCSDRNSVLEQVRGVSENIPVVFTSAVTGEGLDEVRGFLKPGTTAAFTGPSGAGKSALTNRLTGGAVQKTGLLREDDMRGRHTTTHRELFFLRDGSMIIDTPGLRELSPAGGIESVDSAFSEIHNAALLCRYSDCSHTDEPGCEVRRLLDDGTIDSSRYHNYMELRREVMRNTSLKDLEGKLKKKAREKTLSKIIKEYYRK